MKLGYSYIELKRLDEAGSALNRVLLKHPDSIAAAKARQKLKELK